MSEVKEKEPNKPQPKYVEGKLSPEEVQKALRLRRQRLGLSKHKWSPNG